MTSHSQDGPSVGTSQRAASSESAFDEPPIDLAVLEELKSLASPANPDPLREILGLFLSDFPIRYQGLIASWKARDLPQMHAFAHALKGSAANVGARRLMSILATLDRDLRDGVLDNAPNLMSGIEVEFKLAMTFLQDYLRRCGEAPRI